jgi:predicted phage terminase large subunit-like protein
MIQRPLQLPDLSKFSAAEQSNVLRDLGKANKEAAHQYFSYFCVHSFVGPQGFQMAPHHLLLCEILEEVERGEKTRVMVFMPPGHAKSSFISLLYPAWYLGRNPRHNVIGSSHTTEFAETWGRKVRNLINSREYPFDMKLSPDAKASGYWMTDAGGEYYAVGVGGAIAGRRADLGLIDDPIKSREEADSATVRNKLWEWYKADFHTRLKPGAKVVIINTRWHEDDLCGRILPEGYDGRSGWFDGRDGERWYVLSLPALAEANDILGRKVGDALWPQWYTKEMLENEKNLQGERNWSALYQQRPSPEEGDFYQRHWFRWYDSPPQRSTLRVYGASDYAISADRGDYTVHGICGIDANDDMYLLDFWRGQVDSAQAVDWWANMVAYWQPVEWGEDAAQIEKALGPFIDKRQKELNIYVHRTALRTTQDKVQRSFAFRGRVSQGKVYLPYKAPWVNDLLQELLMFPNGKWDDQCDVCSLFGRMLVKMRPLNRRSSQNNIRVLRGYAGRKR